MKWKWHTAKYGDPYSEFVLYIYQSKCTHTAVNTHTHREHTPGAVGSHLSLRDPQGKQLGVRCLAQGHLIVVLKVERALYIAPPPPPTIPARPRL